MIWLERLVKKLIRVGRVKAIYPAKGTVRVQFDDLSSLLSAELQVIHRRTQSDTDYDMYALEEQVLCIFLPWAPTKGYVLGTPYVVAEVPEDYIGKKIFKFEDGTEISYDRNSQLFKLYSANDINVSAVQNIEVSAKNITLTAEEYLVINADDFVVNASNINIIASESLSQEAGASMSMTAPLLTVDAVTTFAKPVAMSAAMAVTGAIAANGGISTPGAGSYDNHVHDYIDVSDSGSSTKTTDGPKQG